MKITTILLGALLLTGCGQDVSSPEYREGVEPTETTESSEDRLNFGNYLPDNNDGSNPKHGITDKHVFGSLEEVLTFEVVNDESESGYITVLDFTVEIEPMLNDRQTVKQNFLSVIDVIKTGGGHHFDVINYEGVALMTNGEFERVVSFDLSKDTIDAIKDGDVTAVDMHLHVNNLHIHHSIEHDLY